MILNPDHITIAVADAGKAIAFFALLDFKERIMSRRSTVAFPPATWACRT